jgi:hypothetical protein
LSIFSGENLPVFFSTVGEVRKLKIKLLERNAMSVPYDPYEGLKFNYTVMFPKIIDIHMDSNREELNVIVNELQKVCSLMHGNISTKKKQEYIFEGYNESVTILAGSGSAKEYRNNFMKRLAENFYNVQWIYNNYPDKRKGIMEEFILYEDTYMKIQKLYPSIPSYLRDTYELLKTNLFTNGSI